MIRKHVVPDLELKRQDTQTLNKCQTEQPTVTTAYPAAQPLATALTVPLKVGHKTQKERGQDLMRKAGAEVISLARTACCSILEKFIRQR